MFPRLKARLGTAVLDRVDLLVELSTLGEYGLADDGMPVETTSSTAASRLPLIPRGRDECPLAGAPSPRSCAPRARP